MNDDKEVTVEVTQEDMEFRARAKAAGVPDVLISMYGTALRRLVADERERIKTEPNVEYERGFIDGMQMQTKSSVDKAVNRMAEQAMLGVWQDVPGAVNFGITGDNNG